MHQEFSSMHMKSMQEITLLGNESPLLSSSHIYHSMTNITKR